MKLRICVAAAVMVASGSVSAAPVDPLTVTIDESAPQRFAALWRGTGGHPTAEQIQKQYLDHGGRGIEVFTPGRIGNAAHLAAIIAKNPEVYKDAAERCLPWVAGTTAELRSVYLGLKGLFPNRPLPQIAVVIGGNNSGGTAGPGIQVIGLEVICRLSADQQVFETWMRHFFAHETVHTFQNDLSAKARKDPLLGQALIEGVPDYVSELVTAHLPVPDRDSWARPREARIWREFQFDAAVVRAGTNANGVMDAKAQAAFQRWFANAGSPPQGWPSELGYWVGMRIAEAYVAKSANPHLALDQLLNPSDPAAIIRESGYAAKFKN